MGDGNGCRQLITILMSLNEPRVRGHNCGMMPHETSSTTTDHSLLCQKQIKFSSVKKKVVSLFGPVQHHDPACRWAAPEAPRVKAPNRTCGIQRQHGVVVSLLGARGV